jgi:hypothetical protein
MADKLTLPEIAIMSALRELNHPDDFVILTIDVADSPSAKLRLTEIYNVETSTLNDDYLLVLQDYITQQLENTHGLGKLSRSRLLDARICTKHCRDNGVLVSLRKPATERLIQQTIRGRLDVIHPVSVSILIQFKTPGFRIPRRVHESTCIVPPKIHEKGRTPSDVGSHATVTPSWSTVVDIPDKPVTSQVTQVNNNQLVVVQCPSSNNGIASQHGCPLLGVKEYHPGRMADAFLITPEVAAANDKDSSTHFVKNGDIVAPWTFEKSDYDSIMGLSRTLQNSDNDVISQTAPEKCTLMDRSVSDILITDNSQQLPWVRFQFTEYSGHHSADVSDPFQGHNPFCDHLTLATAMYMNDSAVIIDDVILLRLHALDDKLTGSLIKRPLEHIENTTPIPPGATHAMPNSQRYVFENLPDSNIPSIDVDNTGVDFVAVIGDHFAATTTVTGEYLPGVLSAPRQQREHSVCATTTSTTASLALLVRLDEGMCHLTNTETSINMLWRLLANADHQFSVKVISTQEDGATEMCGSDQISLSSLQARYQPIGRSRPFDMIQMLEPKNAAENVLANLCECDNKTTICSFVMSQTGDGTTCSSAQSVDAFLGITVKDTGLYTAGLLISLQDSYSTVALAPRTSGCEQGAYTFDGPGTNNFVNSQPSMLQCFAYQCDTAPDGNAIKDINNTDGPTITPRMHKVLAKVSRMRLQTFSPTFITALKHIIIGTVTFVDHPIHLLILIGIGFDFEDMAGGDWKANFAILHQSNDNLAGSDFVAGLYHIVTFVSLMATTTAYYVVTFRPQRSTVTFSKRMGNTTEPQFYKLIPFLTLTDAPSLLHDEAAATAGFPSHYDVHHSCNTETASSIVAHTKGYNRKQSRFDSLQTNGIPSHLLLSMLLRHQPIDRGRHIFPTTRLLQVMSDSSLCDPAVQSIKNVCVSSRQMASHTISSLIRASRFL